MKTRIFSIMDMSKKKAGSAVLCGALLLTLGMGTAFAANVETQNPFKVPKEVVVAPWFSAYFMPTPEIYAPYKAFGITISEDGKSLLYKGQPVRQFVDEEADGWAFYLDETGNGNWSAVRNAAGEITGIERMTAQRAQAYYESFFAEELSESFPKVQHIAMVQETVQVGSNKYEQYQPYGITYSATDGILYFNGQRVKFLIDQPAGEGADALWTDAAGIVNVVVMRDASGQITNLESISDEKAQEYQSASDAYNKNRLNGLEERVEARINALYPEK